MGKQPTPGGFPTARDRARVRPSYTAQQARKGKGEGRRGGSPLGCPARQPKSPAAPRRSRSQTWRQLYNRKPVRRVWPQKSVSETTSEVSRNARRRRRVHWALRYGRRWGPPKSAARSMPGCPPCCLMCRPPHPEPTRAPKGRDGKKWAGLPSGAISDRPRWKQPQEWGGGSHGARGPEKAGPAWRGGSERGP